MVKFDSDSIYNRIIDKLQQDPNWSVITNNSVISAIVRHNAEALAETARYSEYLFKESKWDTAQNTSSILGMANMLGYQAKRGISASGTICISPDPKINLVGYSYSSTSFQDNVIDKEDVTGWGMAKTNVVIDHTWKITDAYGGEYVAVPTIFQQKKSATRLNIIQGKLSTVDISLKMMQTASTQSKLNPYLYIPVTISNCENAATPLTKGLFSVNVVYVSADGQSEYSQEYRVINSLLLSTSTDYDVEVYNDMYSRELFYLKFNNNPSAGPVLDLSSSSSISRISIQYLETSGASGNRESLYVPFTLVSPDNSIVLYGTNLSPITGGTDAETVSDIKLNAPKYYMANYTAGTKEAYINLLTSLKLPVRNMTLELKKVNVYRDTYTNESSSSLIEKYPITAVTFLANGLESLLQNNDTDEICNEIDEYLNTYLDKIKSPQDLIAFKPPVYTPFALNISCKVDKTKVEDLNKLATDIQSMVEDSWGPNADLEFSKNFYSPQIVTAVLNQYPEVVSATTELEAISRVSWDQATRIATARPGASETDSNATIIHTMRIPYSFDTVFTGTLATKGFKDYRTSAQYCLRVDFLYHKPTGLNDNTTYGVSIFVIEDTSRDQSAYYVMSPDTGYWDQTLFNDEQFSKDYSVLTNAYPYKEGASALTSSRIKQVAYRNKVYNDADFKEFLSSIGTSVAENTSSSNTLGTIDNLLIYNSGDLSGTSDSICSGWIEVDFDSIYNVLKYFANFDSNLSLSLTNNCQLAHLKCTYDSTINEFVEFKKILTDYLDVYVSMRPIDGDIIYKGNKDKQNTVLYIDTYDDDSSNSSVSNLTADKKARMLSVSCVYED